MNALTARMRRNGATAIIGLASLARNTSGVDLEVGYLVIGDLAQNPHQPNLRVDTV